MSVGALTTQFTPTPSCLGSDIWRIFTSGAGVVTLYDQQGPPSTIDCLPSGYTPVTTAYYSPAQCPWGYTPAAQFINTYAGNVTETTQTCCPTGRNFTTQATGNQPSFSSLPFLTSLMCHSAHTASGMYQVTSSRSGMIATTSVPFGPDGGEGPNGGINAYGVVVRFQATDFASATSTLISTTNTGMPLPTQSSRPPSQPSSTSLSTAAKAGIASATAVLAIGILATILILWTRRRRRTRASEEAAVWKNGGRTPVEMDANQTSLEMEIRESKQEMDACQMRVEMDGKGSPVELGHEEQRHELDGRSVKGERSQ
ncbi:hypothetical protein BCR34DRAFT_600780 [Clohesyomyces aquaticus]|uniref:Uncharacterized protein n=1 Tax=Clohesyomyces aquaticus TaxID=1231657 RepID=A0A1Y1ZPQ8_9PLEO|nr:hypothetical protein BCR34DRAFT_600780 [Clohesyomyces aquaticus]